ncbi:MAG: S1 RNA-binding domain-containing protein [Kiritimatiellia bacterium]
MTTNIPVPEIGAVIKGRVIRFLEQGALLDIGNGLKGLLHGSQVSWLNKRTKINEFLKIGEELDVIVLKVERSKRSRLFISLSRLKVQENPWETVEATHPVGSRTRSKVVDLLPFGATVEFPTGFRALVHDTEVSWTDRKPKAHDFLRVGDEIDVVIQLIDKKKRRIHASYRQTLPNPWDTFLEVFPIGTVTTGWVDGVQDYGLFVMLGNGCIGLAHKTRLLPTASALLPEQPLKVVIVAYDPENQHAALAQAEGKTLPNQVSEATARKLADPQH